MPPPRCPWPRGRPAPYLRPGLPYGHGKSVSRAPESIAALPLGFHGTYLLDLDGCSEVLFIRRICYHEAMAVCQSDIVPRILCLLVLRAEVSIHDHRCHVSPSVVVPVSLQGLAYRPTHVLLRLILPSFGQVDARTRAGRAGNSESARLRGRVVLITHTVEFPRLQVAPLTRHPQQVTVAVLSSILGPFTTVSVCEHTGTE